MRKGCLALVVLALAAGGAWLAREPLLARVGGLVVEEGVLAPADVVVVLGDPPVLGAVDAAPLVVAGTVRRVLLLAAAPSEEARVLERVGLAQPRPHELAVDVLMRMRVPRDAIIVVPGGAAGTNAEVETVARWAREHTARRLIVITWRSHTRRVGILLRRRLGGDATVVMRAPGHDRFRPERWWRERSSAREFAMEGLRWVNSLALGDLWAAAPAGSR